MATDNRTEFLKVPGGILFRTTEAAESGNGITIAVSMEFVPMDDSTAFAFISEYASQ